MEDTARSDRRFGARVPYPMQVLIVSAEHAWVADVADLSEGGCGVFRPKLCFLAPGNVAQLYFFHGTGPAVSVSALIARVGERHLGFEYHELQTVPPTSR